MKKGQKIGMNNAKSGISGEKYISYDKAVKKFLVMIVVKGKQKKTIASMKP